jgi:hypothetical protein
MATLYVTEFSKAGTNPNGTTQIAVMPPLAEQIVVVGAGSLSSAAFNAATTLIRVATDASCSIAIGTSPAATTSKLRLAANTVEYFGVSAGDKIAVIANA